jgi:hypothetical protein
VLADAEGSVRLAHLAPRVEVAAELEGPRAPIVDTGETAQLVRLSRPRLEELLRAALALSEETPSYVWVEGDSELAVHAGQTRVALAPGTLLVAIRVESDQTGSAEVTVPFALGSEELAAGMVMSTPRRPAGPAAVVDRWGVVLVAAAYRAVLDVLTAAAAVAGVDRDGQALIPGAATTDGRRLTVVPQARHAIDRGRLL